MLRSTPSVSTSNPFAGRETCDIEHLTKQMCCTESHIYWLMVNKGFPRPVGKIGRANLWSVAEVDAWLKQELPRLYEEAVSRTIEQVVSPEDKAKFKEIFEDLERHEKALDAGRSPKRASPHAKAKPRKHR